MNPLPQGISHVTQSVMDNAQGYASWWLDGLTRLYEVQCETAKSVLENQIKQANAILGAKSPSDLVGDPVRTFSVSMEQAIDGMRKSARLMMQMHSELQQLAQKAVMEFGQGAGKLVGDTLDTGKSAPAKRP